MPVWREVLGDLETPVGVYRKLGAEPNSFLLESVEQGERWGRYSFIGLNPFTVMTARDGAVTFDGEQPPSAADAPDPLTALERALFGYKAPALPGLPPLHGGAVGYVGYDVVRYIERLPQTTTDDLGLPELWLLFTGQLLVFDHLRQRLSVISNVVIGDDPAAQYDDAVARAEALVTRIAAPGRVCGRDPLEPNTGRLHGEGRAREGAHRRGRHLPSGALATLRDRHDRATLRRIPGAPAGEPQPVHVLSAVPRRRDRGLVSRAAPSRLRPRSDDPADRRHAPARQRRRGRREARGRPHRRREGASGARDAR